MNTVTIDNEEYEVSDLSAEQQEVCIMINELLIEMANLERRMKILKASEIKLGEVLVQSVKDSPPGDQEETQEEESEGS